MEMWSAVARKKSWLERGYISRERAHDDGNGKWLWEGTWPGTSYWEGTWLVAGSWQG